MGWIESLQDWATGLVENTMAEGDLRSLITDGIIGGVGSVVIFGILPFLGKKEAWREVTVWDDRLISEVTGARERAQIVIVDWPNSQVRSIGVMTSSFETESTAEQFATVYIPTAPQTRYGYIHIIPLKNLKMTDWTLKQWQLYQLSFGSIHPNQLQQSGKSQ